MTRTVLTALTIAAAAALAGTASADVIMIDFGTTHANSLVEPGFVAQTTGSATYSSVAGDVTVESTGSFFNRSAHTLGGPLLGDFTFLNGLDTLTLTIDGPGIAASTDYEIQFWSLDTQHGGGGGTVTYAAVNGTVGGTSIAYSTNPGSTNTATSTWTSNASGEIVIDVTGTNEGPRVSGMAITIVPEPASLALLGLGGLMVMRRK